MKYFFFILITSMALSCKEHTHDASDISVIQESTTQDTPMLRHIVLFKFKESASAADIALTEQGFLKLPSQIEEINKFEWGTNNSPENLNKGFTHSFLVSFSSESNRQTYLVHPAHLEFVKTLEPRIDDVLVIDYWTE